MENKKLFLVLATILCIGLVAAAWYFGYDKTISGNIVSDGKLEIITDLTNFSINTTEGLTEIQNLTFQSKKIDRFMLYHLIVNKTLNEQGCPNWDTDCSLRLEYVNGTQIVNGTLITMEKGYNYFMFNTTCIPDSCGQNITARIILEEQ